MRYLILIAVLLSVGCDQYQQPMSYAPCYLEISGTTYTIRECPIKNVVEHWRAVPTGDGNEALFTVQQEQS